MSPQAVGWLGSLFLALAGIPQLVKTIREGHARGMDWWYLVLLWSGFLAMFAFTIRSHAAIQLTLSYALQLLVFTTIVFYKAFPRKT